MAGQEEIGQDNLTQGDAGKKKDGFWSSQQMQRETR